MPPYNGHHHNHFYYKNHYNGVKSQTVVFPEQSSNNEASATEMVVNKVTEIVNGFVNVEITVPPTESPEVITDNWSNIDEAINAMGITNSSSGAAGGNAVTANLDIWNPVINGSSAVTENLDPSLLNPVVDGSSITEKVELATSYDGGSIFEDITSTIRSYIQTEDGDGQGEHDQVHQGHVGHHMGEKSNPYLILVIVLAVLVVLASVALFLYIRHKKTSASKVSPGVSIVGKKFEPHTFGDKPLAAQTQAADQTNYGGCDDGQQSAQQTKAKK